MRLLSVFAFLMLTFIFSGQLFAQNTKVKINPKVGVNISAIEADLDEIRTSARAGWNAGLDVVIGKPLFISQGLHYYNYSAKLQGRINDVDDFRLEDQTTIRSIKAPFNIGLKLLGLRAQAGIVPTYVIGVNEQTDFAFDIDDLNRLTWGFNIGAGMDILFLTVEANYEIGMSDYFKNVQGANNVLTVSAGIKF